tara:strand:+ start:2012 stop:2227 length:216 start_codon:yes stop_codon:yes gene_type:complete
VTLPLLLAKHELPTTAGASGTVLIGPCERDQLRALMLNDALRKLRHVVGDAVIVQVRGVTPRALELDLAQV